MDLRFVISCVLACGALLTAGCDDGRKAPGKVTVQVANVAPGFASLSFQREQDNRGAAELSFKTLQAFVYDADTYDFFVVERTLNQDDPGRTWTFAPTLEEDTSYTFVLTEVAGEVQPVVIATPPPPANDAQILALHAASGLPAIDVYLERPGVGIGGATPRGTFSAQQQIPASTLPSGDYELFLTAAGNPADVLLTSAQFSLPAGTTSTLLVVDERGLGTAPVSAVLLQSAATIPLFDVNAPPSMRVINAATDRAPRDVAINSELSPPLFSATAFGEPTAYTPLPVGALRVNVTPVGNPGVLELDTPSNGVIGQKATMLFSGPAGALLASFAEDDGRPVNREAKVRFMNAASQFSAIDFVVTAPGGDPLAPFPVAQLFPPSMSSYVPLYPGDYEVYLFRTGTPTIISGPTPISVAAGGIYGVLAVDGPDTATAEVRLLDDFP
jgi:hypothetical protein